MMEYYVFTKIIQSIYKLYIKYVIQICVSLSLKPSKILKENTMIKNYRPVPTLKGNSNFNVAENGEALRNAMKGLGTDEDTIINILTTCNNQQRQQLSEFFKNVLNRNLESDLRSELSSNFEDVIVGLITPPIEYLAKQLNKAMKGLGTDNTALIEIICTRTNDELKELNATYEKLFNRPLVEHVCSETSGDYRKLLTLILTGVRDQPGRVSQEKAKQLAEDLHNAGEGKRGVNTEVFIRIMAHESFEQLRLIFEEYKTISGHTIEQALKSELSSNILEAMITIVELVQNPVTFYAKQLNRSMDRKGTDDMTLIRIIVSRCEIDLDNIKREYERLYDKTLESVVKSETSGDYKKALIALIGGP